MKHTVDISAMPEGYRLSDLSKRNEAWICRLERIAPAHDVQCGLSVASAANPQDAFDSALAGIVNYPQLYKQEMEDEYARR